MMIDRRRAVALGLALAVVAGGAAWWRRSTSGALPPLPPAASVSRASEPTSSSVAPVVVHVAGAVVRSGVVQLPAGARVVDAIDAAGGARRDADVDQLDLAAKVVDGSRIYVPRKGERVPPAPAGSGGGSASGSGTGTSSDGPVNLNTATEAQLDALPGIGPSLAAAIIAERDRRGGFRNVSELGSVRGIGPRRLAELTPLVTV